MLSQSVMLTKNTLEQREKEVRILDVVQNKPKRTPMLFDKWPNIATKNPWLTTIQTTNEQIDLRAMILDEFEKGIQSVEEANKNYE